MKKWMIDLKKETKLMFWLINFYLKELKKYIDKRVQHWNDCFGSVRPLETNTHLKCQTYHCDDEDCGKIFQAYIDDVFCPYCGNTNYYTILQSHYGDYFAEKDMTEEQKHRREKIIALRQRYNQTMIKV